MAIRAQGATEYLVLLAVVLIVALVSVALLGFFPGMASDARLTQSQAYWQSAAPISITEANAKLVCHAAGNFTYPYLRLRNTGAYPITITKIYAGSASITDVWTGTWGPSVAMSTRLSMAPGEEKILGYYLFYSGLPTDRWQFFGFGVTGETSYSSILMNAAQSRCSNGSPYGSLMANDFGFEYTETIEGQIITKRQVGKPLVVKCTEPYTGYC
jgi:hypothetical protein